MAAAASTTAARAGAALPRLADTATGPLPAPPPLVGSVHERYAMWLLHMVLPADFTSADVHRVTVVRPPPARARARARAHVV